MKEELNPQQMAELEEILEMARMTEQQAREMCELSTTIAWKYQKQIAVEGNFSLDTPNQITTKPILESE